ncbi:MAG: HD-GYP domain-containing protein [Chloroflexi bacterium]|nr:HD-GYP domain-containing protein [Chloroflexota bacterium]
MEGAEYLGSLLSVAVVAALLRQHVLTLTLVLLPSALIYLAFRRAREMRARTYQMVAAMADVVDLRDQYTGGHSRRVVDLSAAVLRALGKDGPEAELILAAARVHDIGKIAMPDALLRKEDRLTAAERAEMQTHPERGAELLERYPDFARGIDIVRYHHEHWDGTGYPHRLKGHSIPFGARVVAVADSFDAMTTDRPYRRALSVEQAATVLRAGRGKQWDPTVVDAFLRTIQPRRERWTTPASVAGELSRVPAHSALA